MIFDFYASRTIKRLLWLIKKRVGEKDTAFLFVKAGKRTDGSHIWSTFSKTSHVFYKGISVKDNTNGI